MGDGAWWDFDPQRRRELGDRVRDALLSDSRITDVQFFGSLAKAAPDGHPIDRYSDIDLVIRLRDDNDRSIFADLATIVAQAGPVIAPRRWDQDDLQAAYFWFWGYPPFWHVDIGCPTAHDAGVETTHRAARVREGVQLWILALKRLLRALDTVALVRDHLEVDRQPCARNWMNDELVALLNDWHADATASGEHYDELYSVCLESAKRLLR